MDDLIIRQAVIFTPQGRCEGDLKVEGSKIAQIGDVSGGSAREIDAEGRWIWPGIIDGHVHFREPGLTHKEDWLSGSQAAVSGGVTTVFDMPNTVPSTTTVAQLEEKRALAAAKSRCNYGLFFGAGPDNLEEILRARGAVGLKIFMADSTESLLVDKRADLERIFSAFTGQIAVHAEDQARLEQRRKLFSDREDPAVHSEIRDDLMAAQAVVLAGTLALLNERRLHILHLSTRAELEALAALQEEVIERDSGAIITAEACPHHLFFDVRTYERWGTRVQMNPPLRQAEDRQALWRALARGDLQMIATDHAPHRPDEKARPYGKAPSGVPGVETALPLMLDAAFRGECDYTQVLDWMAHGPATIYGLKGRGAICEGYAADLVMIDPRMTRRVRDEEQRSRAGWTPWAGRDLVGWPVLTIVNGEVVYRREDRGPGTLVGDKAVGEEVEVVEDD